MNWKYIDLPYHKIPMPAFYFVTWPQRYNFLWWPISGISITICTVITIMGYFCSGLRYPHIACYVNNKDSSIHTVQLSSLWWPWFEVITRWSGNKRAIRSLMDQQRGARLRCQIISSIRNTSLQRYISEKGSHCVWTLIGVWTYCRLC